ncbi:MAG: hypothetical protein ISP92_10230, partial [Pseudomonadales bacterium]|nr:hypothetical protein [Pseudomonadales bacterium]
MKINLSSIWIALGLIGSLSFTSEVFSHSEAAINNALDRSKHTAIQKSLNLSESSASIKLEENSLFFDEAKKTIETNVIFAGSDEGESPEIIGDKVRRAFSVAVQLSKAFLRSASEHEIERLFPNLCSVSLDCVRNYRARFLDMLVTDDLPSLLVGGEFDGSISTLAGFVESVGGRPTIFLNPYWAHYLTEDELVPILVEELGHFIDYALFGDSVLEVDEGLQFARAVLPSTRLTFYRELSRFRGAIAYKNERFSAEFASFTFAKTFKVTNVADAQTSSHNFDYSNDLGPSRISDGESSSSFTANDIAAQLYFFNDPNNPVYGYVTRPIKTGSTYRAVYMYTDNDYDSLSKVLAQGPNSDSDGTSDNNGYILVFDGDYFE